MAMYTIFPYSITWLLILVVSVDMLTRSVFIQTRRSFKMSLTSNNIRNHISSNSYRLENQIFQELSELIPLAETKILLSISGGSDSMAMLHLFARIRQNLCPTLSIEIVNFNHKMRLEADEEALFVGHWASTYNIKYHSIVMPDNRLSEESNFQNNARNWRREESLKIIQLHPNESSPYRFIATAHNREDQTETILLKLLRGTHISHLQGMLPLDGAFLKPLLSHGKEELRQYLISNNFTWREVWIHGMYVDSANFAVRQLAFVTQDSSNSNRKYKRNKVRLDIIPLLNEVAGGQEALQDRLLALEEQSKHVQQMVAADCERARRDVIFRRFPGSLAPFSLEMGASFASLSPLVISEILRSWVEEVAQVRSLPYRRLMSMTELAVQPIRFGQRSKAVTICEEWDLQRLGSELRLVRRSQEDSGIHHQSESLVSTFNLSDCATGHEWKVSVSHPEHIAVSATGFSHDMISDSRVTDAVSPTNENVFRFLLKVNVSQPMLSYTLRTVNLPEDTFYSSTTSSSSSSGSGSGSGSDEKKQQLQKEKKVRDVLVNKKVPLHRRDRALVLSEHNDQASKVAAILVSGSQIFIADEFSPAKAAMDNEFGSHSIIEFSVRAGG